MSTPDLSLPLNARRHRALVKDAERWKARAMSLDRLIQRHERMIQGPGPAADFAVADEQLWAARKRLAHPVTARRRTAA